MKLKEVLQKVTENLEVENDIKVQIKTAEKNVQILEEKLEKSEMKLEHGYHDLAELENELLEDLKSKAVSITKNFISNISLNESEDIVTSLEFKFMGKSYKLIDDEYVLIAGNHVLEISEVIEEIYKKYLEIGSKLLNAESVNKLQDFEKLYSKNPKKVVAGFEQMKKDSVVKSLEKKLETLRSSFKTNLNSLETLTEKIEKAKVFKSKLAQKLFDKRAKLQEKQNKLYNETEDMGMSIKAIEMELADRSQINNDVKIYVDKQIYALHTVLDLFKGLEVAKYRLESHETSRIYYVKQEIQGLEKDKQVAENNLEDLKAMLKLNRKVNKETIAMAFKDKEFGIELDNTDSDQISTKEQKAYEMLQAKYDQIIAAKIKKII